MHSRLSYNFFYKYVFWKLFLRFFNWFFLFFSFDFFFSSYFFLILGGFIIFEDFKGQSLVLF